MHIKATHQPQTNILLPQKSITGINIFIIRKFLLLLKKIFIIIYKKTFHPANMKKKIVLV